MLTITIVSKKAKIEGDHYPLASNDLNTSDLFEIPQIQYPRARKTPAIKLPAIFFNIDLLWSYLPLSWQ
jgi:hypothetical protein